MNYTKSLLLLCLCFLLGVTLSAQSNAGQQNYEVVTNTSLTGVSVNSMIKPIVLTFPENGQASFSYAASGVYNLTYTPTEDFTGSDYFVAEYYENNGTPTPKYIHFNVEIKSSIIQTQQDFANGDINSTIVISPLDNDYASHGPLTILAASYVSNGTIDLNAQQEILFTPETDFTGDAYINYIVQDTIGSTALGTIKIGVNDIANIPTYEVIKIATTNKNPATILLPISGFAVDNNDAPDHGTVNFIGTDVVEYTSNFGNAAIDSFTLKKGSEYERLVIVETIYIPQPNGFVINDYVITTINTPVTFDVQANDIKKNFPIVDFTDDARLIQDTLDQSIFTFTPSTDFSGEVVFSYTVTNGTYNETAYITIVVSNFEPDNSVFYQLTTPKNTPLVINYDIPISNFSFIENEAPVFGNLNIYEGIDTIAIGCEDISGYNLVTYTPSQDFVGSDQFEILYCVDNNACELVKVQVTVEDIGLDSICLCIQDCVWAGDADNDGKVSVADLLPIAYHQGESGTIRDEAGTAVSWFGQHAEDWNVQQVYSENDVKHVDANGDGLIEGDDLNDIINYYNRFHDLIAPDNLVIKDYPFQLVTNQDTIYAGEYLHLEIHIGSEQYPAINLHGLAYGLSFPAVLIDSSSCAVDFLNDEWFGNNSPALEMAVQPSAGRVEASFSRTSGIPISGYGLVATVDFIVEEDVEGVKIGEEIIPLDFHLEAIKVTGVGGETFTLPPFTKTLYLDLRGRKEAPKSTEDIHLYPNPATNQIFIHGNNETVIHNVSVLSLDGSLISSQKIEFTTARLDINNLQQGLYIAKVETEAGIIYKKFFKE